MKLPVNNPFVFDDGFLRRKSSCDGTLHKSAASQAVMDWETSFSSCFRGSCASSRSGYLMPTVGELILVLISHVKYSVMDWKLAEGAQ
jgi:hypothetical protein